MFLTEGSLNGELDVALVYGFEAAACCALFFLIALKAMAAGSALGAHGSFVPSTVLIEGSA